MKLRIDTAQLNELSDAQKQRLRELWDPQYGDAIFVPAGTRFGDWFGKWKDELSDEDSVCYIGNVEGIGEESEVSKEPCLLLPEYANDSYLEIMIKDCLPLVSVGQMIEILKEYDRYNRLPRITHNYDSGNNYIDVEFYGKDRFISTENLINNNECNELCDALWQAVKEIL